MALKNQPCTLRNWSWRHGDAGVAKWRLCHANAEYSSSILLENDAVRPNRMWLSRKRKEKSNFATPRESIMNQFWVLWDDILFVKLKLWTETVMPRRFRKRRGKSYPQRKLQKAYVNAMQKVNFRRVMMSEVIFRRHCVVSSSQVWCLAAVDISSSNKPGRASTAPQSRREANSSRCITGLTCHSQFGSNVRWLQRNIRKAPQLQVNGRSTSFRKR